MKHTLALTGIFALAAIFSNSPAGAQVKIDPAPASSDQLVTVSTPASMAGGAIAIYTAASGPTCNASAAPVALEPFTNNLALAAGTTKIAIQKGMLLGGNYLCASVTAARPPPSVSFSTGVQITATPALGAPTLSINPAPSSSDQFIVVITPASMTGGTIAFYSAASQGACSATASPVELEPNTGNVVLTGGTTKVAISKGKLKSGNYVCAVVTASGVQTTSGAVQVKDAPAPGAANLKFDPNLASGDSSITFTATGDLVNDTVTIQTATTADACASSKTTVGTTNMTISSAGPTTITTTPGTLAANSYVCAVVKDADGKTAATQAVEVKAGCPNNNPPGSCYADSTYDFSLIGGIEQSDLSAQSSTTNGFYDLFIRRPVASKWMDVWLRSRYLGAPSSSSTSNVVGAATDPTGTLTAKNLPQSVNAVDYILGLQFKNFSWGSPVGRFTAAPAAGFGATTPLDSNTVVNGFQVPAYGTNECNQLHDRFTAKKGYSPPLPPDGFYTDSTSNKTVHGCVVQPATQGGTATTTDPGTQITAIAFSNEDRSSFLLKWGAGVRVVDRYTAGCTTSGGCPRIRADFSIGQDQSITGGYLRHWVFKADAIIPVFSTGTYFFASSANRLVHNTTSSPLILTPVTVNSGGSSACATPTATSVCVPSGNVFVLPYKQGDRDFYRIGVGIDAVKVFTKLFGTTPPS